MEFITKKEFESALIVIEKALKSNQLQIINATSDEKSILEKMMFLDEHYSMYASNAVSFVPGSQAIKETLHKLRKDLKSHKEHNSNQAKLIEDLEKKEQTLVAKLPLLKE